MAVMSSSYTVAELCRQLAENSLTVNRKYQRSEKVWPDTARSFLVETIVLGYPLPKIILWEKTDVETLSTHREVVDGQQRTYALRDFFYGELRLTNNLETEDLCGRVFAELPVELQQRFATYSVGCDILLGADEEAVREIFRRMNSYTVPLNPEEQRHAQYQGEFKWFIYELSKATAVFFESIGTFKEKDFVRMRDSKLLTEIVHALLYGIDTTTKTKLNKLYKSKDAEFPEHEELRADMLTAFEYFEQIADSISETALVKSYNIYSLFLAIVAMQSGRQELLDDLDMPRRAIRQRQRVVANLGLLAESLTAEDAEEAGAYRTFFEATSEKTNTAATRALRARWFAKALTETF